MANLTPCSKF